MSPYIAVLCWFLSHFIDLSSCQIIFPQSCMTPNNEYAQCYPLEYCPRLVEALATKDPIVLQFVEQSRCGGTAENPSVCCGPSSNFTVSFDSRLKEVTESTKHEVTDSTKHEVTESTKHEETTPHSLARNMGLLPNRSVCGFQHSDDYVGDESITTKITEFPWLAAIFAKNENLGKAMVLGCVGSVIDGRYVLTQAYCVSQKNLVKVHLGEYDLNTDEDCVQERHSAVECSEPVQVFDIEKTIVHPDYSAGGLEHDIALIRLNRKAQYNDYVRPICLPFPGTTFAQTDAVVRSCGWGMQDTVFLTPSNIKKKFGGSLTNLESCAEAFAEERTAISNGNYVCVSRDTPSDYGCDGGSGRPLLYSHKAQWHQEGIATRLGSCDGQSPDVYLKIVNYLDWIQENIEK